MVGGLQLGRELSFTIRNVKPASGSEDQSMTRRLQMMHTSRNSHDLSSMLASDKDRLENVLVCICNEAILKSAFYDFLSERFAENLLSFRDEVDTLKALAFKIKSDHFNKSNEDRRGSRLLWRSNVPEDPKVTILAAKIFSKYIGPGAPKLICVDRLTQQAITDALKVNRAGRVNEKNASILADVFDEANNKVFQQLIYDHLAHFLLSDHYKNANKPVQPVALDEIDGEDSDQMFHTIIAHPICSYYFKKYLQHVPEVLDSSNRFPCTEQLECLYEMLDFRTSTDPEHLTKRCVLIVTRYGRVQYGVEELILLRNEYLSDPDSTKFNNASRDMFDSAYFRLSHSLLANHLSRFLSSRYYKELEEVSTRQDVFNALDQFKGGNLGCKLIEQCGVPESETNLDELFDLVLEDPLGISLFKRFVTSHLQEENINFYLEAKYFKEENYVSPPVGSAFYCDEFTSIDEMRWLRAMKITCKYVEVGARMQINVGTHMRERILRQMASPDKNVELSIFEEAQHECKKLMKQNLWSKFQGSDSFRLFARKVREKKNAIHKVGTKHNLFGSKRFDSQDDYNPSAREGYMSSRNNNRSDYQNLTTTSPIPGKSGFKSTIVTVEQSESKAGLFGVSEFDQRSIRTFPKQNAGAYRQSDEFSDKRKIPNNAITGVYRQSDEFSEKTIKTPIGSVNGPSWNESSSVEQSRSKISIESNHSLRHSIQIKQTCL